MAQQKLTVTVDLDITEAAVNKCLRVLDIYLESHEDKTIVVEEENGVRVCLIANRQKEENNG